MCMDLGIQIRVMVVGLCTGIKAVVCVCVRARACVSVGLGSERYRYA